jgi:hypothetical protein
LLTTSWQPALSAFEAQGASLRDGLANEVRRELERIEPLALEMGARSADELNERVGRHVDALARAIGVPLDRVDNPLVPTEGDEDHAAQDHEDGRQ